MEAGLKDELLRLEKGLVIIFVEDELCVMTILNVLSFHQRLQSRIVSCMLSHVSCKYAAYNSLSEHLLFVLV